MLIAVWKVALQQQLHHTIAAAPVLLPLLGSKCVGVYMPE